VDNFAAHNNEGLTLKYVPIVPTGKCHQLLAPTGPSHHLLCETDELKVSRAFLVVKIDGDVSTEEVRKLTIFNAM
jgi:hypothetical protein